MSSTVAASGTAFPLIYTPNRDFDLALAPKVGAELSRPGQSISTPFDLIAQWRKDDLTSEEKKRFYAKYYDRAPATPDVEVLRAMERQCDRSKILWPENINDLLNPGYLEVENGWCQMANGGGFIAHKVEMPGVTTEMIYWWFTYFTLNDMRYKIWYRPSHLGHYISPERRKKILDPKSRIPQDTLWGATHYAVEDIGTGPEVISIHFFSPEDMGFDMARFKPPNVSALVGGYGDEQSLINRNLPTGCAIMCHIIRDVPGGVELRTRFWMGYRIQNRKPDFCVPPGEKVPAEVVQGLAVHNEYEFANLRTLLPEIYSELQGRPWLED